jgi:hypothetical protein
MLGLLLSSNVKAQSSSYALSVQGGYSWINGVVGGDLQIGHFGIGGGWMPTKMPLSGTNINSIGFHLTYYSSLYNEYGYYVSVGEATSGFRYEDTWGGESTLPMTIIMIGIKSGTDNLYLKLGGGYGWCDYGNAWTFEATLGIPLFRSK